MFLIGRVFVFVCLEEPIGGNSGIPGTLEILCLVVDFGKGTGSGLTRFHGGLRGPLPARVSSFFVICKCTE